MKVICGSPWPSPWVEEFLDYARIETQQEELIGLRLARPLMQRLTNDNSRVERTRKE
jgi:hypothetical protein